MRAELACRAWLRTGEQSFKSSPFSNYFPSWMLQHPISLTFHLQTLSLVSSHLSWLWKTACFQEIFWLGLRFQHYSSQVQQLFLLLLESWMGLSMCPASLPSPRYPISEHLQLLTGSCSSLKELCALSSPQHSPNPAGRRGALPRLMRSSSTELIPLQPLHFPSTKPLPLKYLQPFLPSLAEEPSGGRPAVPRETQPLCGTSGASQSIPALSAEAVLIQVQGKEGGFVNMPPMMGIHQGCDNASHLLSALVKRQNFTDCCDL